MTLVFDDSLRAVSNTPIVEEGAPAPGLQSVRFGETPVMSTYLLAFVVGDLVSGGSRRGDGTKIGVWTTRGKENQAGFALDTSVKLLGYFNDYFGIPYPLPKLDHIAIPDFAAGGDGELGLHYVPGRPPCWWTRITLPQEPGSVSPKWWPMRWRTCGSATW